MTTIPQCPFCASRLGLEHWRMSFLFPSQHLCSKISFGLITEYHLNLHLLNYFRPIWINLFKRWLDAVVLRICEKALFYIKWTDMISLKWIIHTVSMPCVNHTWCKEKKNENQIFTWKLLVKRKKCCIELNMEFWSRKSEMVL